MDPGVKWKKIAPPKPVPDHRLAGAIAASEAILDEANEIRRRRGASPLRPSATLQSWRERRAELDRRRRERAEERARAESPAKPLAEVTA